MSNTERSGARQRIEAARQKIVADMDRCWQTEANAEADITCYTRVRDRARAEREGLRSALDALGPKPTRDRSKAGNGAAKKPPKPPREAGDARQRTLAAATEAGLLPPGETGAS